MQILVTGGAGCLGSDLAPLLARYYNVKVTDIKKPNNDLEFIHCDISKLGEVEQATKGVDVIIHLAALLPISCPSNQFIDVNVKGTCNILEASLKNGVKKVVYASSVWAASRGASPYQPIDENIPCKPEGMYDITKRMGEEFCEYFHRLYGLNTMTLRLCGYDPIDGFSSDGDILWDKVNIQALAGRFVGSGPSFKLTNAWDLAQAFKAAVENEGNQYDVFIIGLGLPFVQNDAEELSKDPLTALEKHFPDSTNFFNDIGLEIPKIEFWYNTEKAKKHLGFSPKFSLQDVIQQYYEYK
jgi:nucleoside-diphosphate-sugar epimerase